jgi:hypothetical protein
VHTENINVHTENIYATKREFPTWLEKTVGITATSGWFKKKQKSER